MKKFYSLFVLLFTCFLAFPADAQPIAKHSLWKSIQRAVTFSSRKTPQAVQAASRAASAAAISAEQQAGKVLTPKPIPPLQPSPQVLASAVRASIVQDEFYLHAVWRVEFGPGQPIAYLKMTTEEEIARTKIFHEIVKDILPHFDLIDIEYPHILAEGYGGLPAKLEKQVKKDMDSFRFRLRVRDVDTRVKIPVVLSKVDTRGLTFAQQHEYLSSQDAQAYFRNEPITAEEWGQIQKFVKTYVEENFNHGDLTRNFHLRRGADGRLKLSILDFEMVGEPFGDLVMLNIWEQLLRKEGCLAF